MQLESSGIVEALRLFLDRIHDGLPAVPRVHGPQARDAIQNLAAIMRRVVHILRADQQARGGFELTIGGERHPQRLEIELGENFLFAGTHCDPPED
jgi:hypothetical protein